MHSRAQRPRSIGCPATSSTWQLRQVAGERPGLEDQPQSLLGPPIPVWISDDPRYPCTDVSVRIAPADRASSRRPPSSGNRRARSPEPRYPTGGHVPTRARGARLLVRVRLHAVRPGALSVRERRIGSRRITPATSLSSTFGQIRGWFYSLHVLAMALFDRPAFCTCLSPRHRPRRRRREDLKSLNYPDPMEVFDSNGADADGRRICSPHRSCVAPTSRDGCLCLRDTARQVLLPLCNTWYFLTLYATPGGGCTVGFGERCGAAVLTNVLDVPRPRQDTRPSSRMLRGRWRHTTGRLRGGLQHRRDPDELVHPPQSPSLLEWRLPRHRHTLHTVLDVRGAGLAAPPPPSVTYHIYAGLHGDSSPGHRPDPGRSSRHLADVVASRTFLVTRHWCGRWTRYVTSVRQRCQCVRRRIDSYARPLASVTVVFCRGAPAVRPKSSWTR